MGQRLPRHARVARPPAPRPTGRVEASESFRPASGIMKHNTARCCSRSPVLGVQPSASNEKGLEPPQPTPSTQDQRVVRQRHARPNRSHSRGEVAAPSSRITEAGGRVGPEVGRRSGGPREVGENKMGSFATRSDDGLEVWSGNSALDLSQQRRRAARHFNSSSGPTRCSPRRRGPERRGAYSAGTYAPAR